MNKKNFIFLLTYIIIIIFFKNLYTQIYFYKKALKIEKKSRIKAVFYYVSSIQAYTPFSFIVEKSINRLLKMYKYYFGKKDYYNAFYILEMLKSSIYSIRSFYQPYTILLKKIKKNLIIIKNYLKNNNNSLNKYLPIKKNYKQYEPSTCKVFLFEFFLFLFIFLTLFFLYNYKKYWRYKFLFIILNTIIWILWMLFLYLA